MVNIAVDSESIVTIFVSLAGRIEREVSFTVETLDTLTIPNYMTVGKSIRVNVAIVPQCHVLLILTGIDYTSLTLGGTFSPAIGDSQQFSFILELIDDSVVENTEILFISLSSNDPAVIVISEADQIDLTISDDDGNNYSDCNIFVPYIARSICRTVTMHCLIILLLKPSLNKLTTMSLRRTALLVCV